MGTAEKTPEEELQANGYDIQLLDRIIYQNNEPGASIVILQKAQSQFGCVTPGMLARISEITGAPKSELYGIVTFYSQFRLQPPGKYLIQACCGTACHLGGAEKITQAIEDSTGASEGMVSENGLFSLERVACLGCCSMAPVMTVNGDIYGRVTPKTVKKITQKIESQE